MAKSNLRLVSPDSKLRTVTLRRRSNRDMGRDREHLTELEVDRLMKAAKGNRHGQRDATMILIGFRHGLRVSELCDLQWSSIAFETGTMHVRRAKGGEAATHPILGDELRALRELKRQSASPFVFASERGGPFTPSGFAKLLARAGDEAKIGFKVHPHMLRHACGYALADKGIDTRTLQAYLGHRSINSTTRYAAPAGQKPGRAGRRSANRLQHLQRTTPPREGEFALKYFTLREATRAQKPKSPRINSRKARRPQVKR